MASQSSLSVEEMESNAPDLDQILQTVELENKKASQLLEKENQHILALETTITEKEDGIRRLEQDVDKFDEDAKNLHRQFRQNKDNLESLKNHCGVLTHHADGLHLKLIEAKEKTSNQRLQHAERMNKYNTIWENYQKRYEARDNAMVLKQLQIEVTKSMQQMDIDAKKIHVLKESIVDLEKKKESRRIFKDVNDWIVHLAKVRSESLAYEKQSAQLKHQVRSLQEDIKKVKEQVAAKRKANEEILKQREDEAKRLDEEKQQELEHQKQENERKRKIEAEQAKAREMQTAKSNAPFFKLHHPQTSTRTIPTISMSVPRSTATPGTPTIQPITAQQNAQIPTRFFIQPMRQSSSAGALRQPQIPHPSQSSHVPQSPKTPQLSHPQQLLFNPQSQMRVDELGSGDASQGLRNESDGRSRLLQTCQGRPNEQITQGSGDFHNITSVPSTSTHGQMPPTPVTSSQSVVQDVSAMEVSTPSSCPGTPTLPLSQESGSVQMLPKTPEGGIDMSLFQQKLEALHKSPGFQFSARPMYENENGLSQVPTPRATASLPESSMFLSSFTEMSMNTSAQLRPQNSLSSHAQQFNSPRMSMNTSTQSRPQNSLQSHAQQFNSPIVSNRTASPRTSETRSPNPAQLFGSPSIPAASSEDNNQDMPNFSFGTNPMGIFGGSEGFDVPSSSSPRTSSGQVFSLFGDSRDSQPSPTDTNFSFSFGGSSSNQSTSNPFNLF